MSPTCWHWLIPHSDITVEDIGPNCSRARSRNPESNSGPETWRVWPPLASATRLSVKSSASLRKKYAWGSNRWSRLRIETTDCSNCMGCMQVSWSGLGSVSKVFRFTTARTQQNTRSGVQSVRSAKCDGVVGYGERKSGIRSSHRNGQAGKSQIPSI